MDIFRRSAAQEPSFFVARGPAGGVKPARALRSEGANRRRVQLLSTGSQGACRGPRQARRCKPPALL